MQLTTLRILRVLPAMVLAAFVFFQIAEARVEKEGNKTYLVDRTGERWDITQAVSIGFNPYKFEFGIGRNAFKPLDERDWPSGSGDDLPDMRIIGIARGGDAHAYSVNRLRHHETANTFLESEAIVAGY